MGSEKLIHKSCLQISEQEYEILVFCRGGERFIAKTFFSPQDVIINDGLSLEEVLGKHRRLLPLAVNSRKILRDSRSDA